MSWRQQYPLWRPGDTLAVGRTYRIDRRGMCLITILQANPIRIQVRVGGRDQGVYRVYSQFDLTSLLGTLQPAGNPPLTK